jgi:hypothetical protein
MVNVPYAAVLFCVTWKATRTLAFVPHLPIITKIPFVPTTTSARATNNGFFFADTVTPISTPTIDESSVDTQQQTLSRPLGSQELLMLPRQYSLSKATFPQMNHVSVTILSETPSSEHVKLALLDAVQSHPLLRAHVSGTGEPETRTDAFQMVRRGEPSPLTFTCTNSNDTILENNLLKMVPVDTVEDLTASWKCAFARDLDDGSWCQPSIGPLWKMELHATNNTTAPCAIVLASNHAISDQTSANKLMNQVLENIVALEENQRITHPGKVHAMPVTMEDSVLGTKQRWSDVAIKGASARTIAYVVNKAMEGFKNPVILPDGQTPSSNNNNPLGAISIISGRAAGGQDSESQQRKSTVQFRSLSKEATSALLQACRSRDLSVSNVLTAAVTLTTTDFVDNGVKKDKRRNYKVLQSLDMRRFGAKLDQGETVACMAGSHDLIHGSLKDRTGLAIRSDPSPNNIDIFWKLASDGKRQTEAFIASGGPEEAVRVFDFAMTVSDLNNLVYLSSQSKDTKGRAYSAGVTNVGVYERQESFQREGGETRPPLRVRHGRFGIRDVFFATPHTQSGCLYQVSCITVNGELKLTFNPVTPLVSEETNERFANAFVDLLETVSFGKKVKETGVAEASSDAASSLLPDGSLVLATSVLGLAACLSHGGGWANFFRSVAEMKANVEVPADFWAALNFWIFFAVGHPILQPILWISDVLHGSPGPLIGGLVPVTFLAGNLIAIAALTLSKQVSFLHAKLY